MAVKDETQLITEWIEQNPHYPGPSNVRIKGYGNSVWALVGDLGAVDGDLHALAWEFDLPVEAVEAAMAYYRAHKEVIDARLAANNIHLTGHQDQ